MDIGDTLSDRLAVHPVITVDREFAALLQITVGLDQAQLPEGEFLLNEDNVKVCLSAKDGKVCAWLTFEAKGLIDVRKELYNLTSKIDKCFVINEASVCQQK